MQPTYKEKQTTASADLYYFICDSTIRL